MDDLDIYGDLESFDAKVENDKYKEKYHNVQEKYDVLYKDHEELKGKYHQLKENMANIKCNFQSLLETARVEIARKDSQIQELRKEKDNIAFRRTQKPYDKNVVQDSRHSDTWKSTAVGDKAASKRSKDEEGESQDFSDSKSHTSTAVAEKETSTKSRDKDRRDDRRVEDLRRDISRENSRRTSRDRFSSSEANTPPRHSTGHRDRDRQRPSSSYRRSPDRHRNRGTSRRDGDSPENRHDLPRERNQDSNHHRKRPRDDSPRRREPHKPVEKRIRSESDSKTKDENKDCSRKRPETAPLERGKNEDGSSGEKIQCKDRNQGKIVSETTSASSVTPQNGKNKTPVADEELVSSTTPTEEKLNEPLVTSFAGSLERLKKEAVLINTEGAYTAPLIEKQEKAPAPKSESPRVILLEGDGASNHSELMPENTLQISAEIRSSNASYVTSAPSPETKAAPLPSDQVVEFVIQNPADGEILQMPPNLHPHLNPLTANDHLPLMVIPPEAVIIPLGDMSVPPPPLPRAVDETAEVAPPPPPKPKIQTVSGNRDPYQKKVKPVVKESNLTVANLEVMNDVQEKEKLKYLKEEFLRVGGPEIANDPQLLKSFEQKEKQLERRKLLGDQEGEPIVVGGSTAASTHKNHQIMAVNKTAAVGQEKGIAEERATEEKQTLPTQQPAEGKCIIMGNSKYNFKEDPDGVKVMVVSRLKKKKKKTEAEATK